MTVEDCESCKKYTLFVNNKCQECEKTHQESTLDGVSHHENSQEKIELIIPLLNTLIEISNSDIEFYNSEIIKFKNSCSNWKEDDIASSVILNFESRNDYSDKNIKECNKILKGIFKSKTKLEKINSIKDWFHTTIHIRELQRDIELQKKLINMERETDVIRYDIGEPTNQIIPYHESSISKTKDIIEVFEHIKEILKDDYILENKINQESFNDSLTNPLDILKIRLAKGEISIDEYDVIKSRLDGTIDN
jgi:hypothetical protein